MKIVIIGGTGLIGTQLGALLQQTGHQVVAAAPSTGVDTLTGQGLDAALQGAQVVVDVSNSPSFEAEAVMHFFETSTRNLTRAAAAARVPHVVALSIVGVDVLPGNAYFHAKVAQERLLRESGLPWSVVRATQFHEFIATIADSYTRDGVVHAPSAGIQTIASADVARALADTALGAPLNDWREIGGPQRSGIDALLREFLAAKGDPRTVQTDDSAGYFGAPVQASTLQTHEGAWIAPTTWQAWLARSTQPA
jgi:uncharacterized protein YbjT (DUF2867 family)